jgi:hypothetical protein
MSVISRYQQLKGVWLASAFDDRWNLRQACPAAAIYREEARMEIERAGGGEEVAAVGSGELQCDEGIVQIDERRVL